MWVTPVASILVIAYLETRGGELTSFIWVTLLKMVKMPVCVFCLVSVYFVSCYNGTVNNSCNVLSLLADPILQHHGDGSHIIGSSLGSPDSEDSKDVEDLVSCHWEAVIVSIFYWPCLHCEISYNPVPHFQRKQSVCIFKQKLPVWNDYSALSLLRLFTSFVKGYRAANRSLMYYVSAGVFQCSKEPLLQCSLLGSTWSILIWVVTGVLNCTSGKPDRSQGLWTVAS